MLAEKFPLQWPLAYPRTKWPKTSRFGNVSFAKGRDEIFKELRLMLTLWKDRESIVLSTNVPLKNDGFPYATFKPIEDKGVAVYFLFKGEQMVICCDAWNKIEHNMWAVAQTIKAMRAIERWGVSDFLKSAFAGFTALPPSPKDQPKRDWWLVFNYQAKPGPHAWDWAGVQAQYKSLVKKKHPDAGGSTEAFQELNNAYEEAKKYYGQ